MGIDKYNAECRAIVMRYASEWRATVDRMARWIDFDNDYKTLDTPFMESVWWVFKELYEKNLVYRGFMVGVLRLLSLVFFFFCVVEFDNIYMDVFACEGDAVLYGMSHAIVQFRSTAELQGYERPIR